MKYFSMFSGIGGFEYGIEQAFSNKQSTKVKQDRKGRNRNSNKRGYDVLPTGGTTPLCIGFSEIDKYAIQIYKKQFKHKNYGDATTINTKQLPNFDLLVGGFPCQAFSIAGKRKGFNDTRGTLFFEIARILADKRPRYFVLENVKGLLSHDEGKTFQTILGILTDLGYEYQWQVLNSKNFGVPQNRERVFIVGHIRGEPRPEVFPIGENDGISSKRQRQVSPTITQRYYKQGQSDHYIVTEGPETGKSGIFKERDKPNSPDISRGETHTTSPLRWVRTEKGKKYRREAKRKGRDLTPFNEGYRELVEAKEKVSGCITNALQKDALLKQDMKIRRLTPTECERLQGFPDGWTEGISDTQRYKCLGNAVTTNVVRVIIERLSLVI